MNSSLCQLDANYLHRLNSDMKNTNPSELLKTAIKAVKLSANHAMDNLSRRKEALTSDEYDIKLVLDVECQEIIQKSIHEIYPEHGILGEEGSSLSKTNPYEWIIDPIDGTVNFSHGFPYWCSSVAVKYNNVVVAGAVYAPEIDELFYASAYEAAYCNNDIITVNDNKNIETSMILTGMNKHRIYDENPPFTAISKIAKEVRKVRIAGAAALDICQIAAGRCDAFVEYGLYIWDYAAAGLIAQRAGAFLTECPDPLVPHRSAVFCSNQQIKDSLIPLWKEEMPYE